MIPLNKLINTLIEEIAGENVIPLIDLLWGKENVSEFKLADKMEITVNQGRNMLYKLHSRNLVDFIRKKDKRKGWYIYYWTFDLRIALTLLISLRRERLALLENRLKQKQVEDYFACPKKCVILRYDSAMENDFKCPECGNILQRLNMKKQVSVIKKQLVQIRIEIEDGKVYLEKEIERLEKKKARLEKRKKVVKKRVRKRKKKVVKKKVKKKKKKPKIKRKKKKKKVKKKKIKKRKKKSKNKKPKRKKKKKSKRRR